jgi:hypothetical protein
MSPLGVKRDATDFCYATESVAYLPNLCAVQCRFTIAAVHRPVLIASLWVASLGLARADATSDALAEVSRCSAIAEPAERLRCFDRAALRAKEALVPKTEDFGKPTPRRPEVEQVMATVRDLSKTVRGRAVFVLDNGQTWRQLEGDDAQVVEAPPGTTLKVTIARGAFGSYNLTIEGRNGMVRVRRVE